VAIFRKKDSKYAGSIQTLIIKDLPDSSQRGTASHVFAGDGDAGKEPVIERIYGSGIQGAYSSPRIVKSNVRIASA